MKIQVKAIEENTLIQIIDSGVKPLETYYDEQSGLYDATFDNVLTIQTFPMKQVKIEMVNTLDKFIIGGNDYVEIIITNS